MAECSSDCVEADSITAEESSEAARSDVVSVEEARFVAVLGDAESACAQAPNESAAIKAATSKALLDFMKRFLPAIQFANKGKRVHGKKIGMSWSPVASPNRTINSKSILLVDYIGLNCNRLAEVH